MNGKLQGKQVVTPKDNTNILKRIGCIIAIFAMYGIPVYIAYHVSMFIEPIIEKGMILPIEDLFLELPALLLQIIVGPFGLLTLGVYSFIWAFPVVVLVGITIAITNDIGLKQFVTNEIDPWLRKIGLEGRDVIPIISGYGCNVVAVYQSKGCSSCTRKQCLSMISYGSACSYQIGATLSLFSVAGKPWLFFPYIILLAVIGIFHTKIWYPQKQLLHHNIAVKRSVLQKPSLITILQNLKEIAQQFFFQAMPIFLAICVIAAILNTYKIFDMLSKGINPILSLLSLPGEAGPGILFSIIRKDGMLLFNEGNGQLITGLTTIELFILVYLASTFSACIVTLFAIGRNAGISTALQMAIKQVITSIVSTLLIVVSWNVIYSYFF